MRNMQSDIGLWWGERFRKEGVRFARDGYEEAQLDALLFLFAPTKLADSGLSF